MKADRNRALAANSRPAKQPLSTTGVVLRALALSLIALHLGSCTSIGPGSISTDRGSYIQALATTDKEELLANIVRVKYMDPPVFLQISSLSASPSLELGLEAQARVGGPSVPPPTGFIKPTVTYEDNPTVVYKPLLGKQFANELLLPIGATPIFLMLNNGFEFEIVARLLFAKMNRLSNRRNSPAAERARFQRAVAALGRLVRAGLIEVGTPTEGLEKPDAGLVLTVDERTFATEDGQLVFSEFELDRAETLNLRIGLNVDRKSLTVTTRSVLSILAYLSNYVLVPPEHGDIVWPFDSSNEDAPVIEIHSSRSPPGSANPAVFINGFWFYVRSADIASRNVFYLLRLVFNLQAQQADDDAGRLYLTLPVR